MPPASASSLHTDAPSSSENGTAPHRGSGYGEPPTRNPFASPSPPLHDSSSTEEDERELTPKSANASLPGPSDQVALRLDTQFPGVSVRVQTSPSPSPSTPSGLRRPPLPTMTLPPSPALASASASAAQSRKQTPLASPSLATYRAPEDLDALVPDGQVDYFVEQWYADLMDANDLEEAHRKYFRDPEDRQRELEEAEAERAERAEMADVELDGDMDDDADDVRWTDEEVVAEVEEEEEEEEEGPGLEDDVHEDDADQPEEVEDDALPEAGAVAEPPQPIPEDLENDINIEDDMDGALEGKAAHQMCIVDMTLTFCS